jgi:hypothetical protein
MEVLQRSVVIGGAQRALFGISPLSRPSRSLEERIWLEVSLSGINRPVTSVAIICAETHSAFSPRVKFCHELIMQL